MSTPVADLPALIDSAARESLSTRGYCVIERALEPALRMRIQEAVYRIAEFERSVGWTSRYAFGNDATANQRIWNLLSRDPLFCQLVEHDLAIAFVTEVIGWPALLSSTSANIVVNDDENTAIHADQSYMPEPWGSAHGVNIAWTVDDFTSANGATRVAPGSHRLNRAHRPDEELPEFVPVEAPAGSMIVMDGRVWHTTGRNLSGRPRCGIFNWYTLPIYLPQENWYLSLNPAVRQFGSERLLTLLGFRPGLMGRVNGLQPTGL
jgi:ectoine hydroxylase-related dioxygenase (phytanoyl-CoA dioxygenase family)